MSRTETQLDAEDKSANDNLRRDSKPLVDLHISEGFSDYKVTQGDMDVTENNNQASRQKIKLASNEL